MELSQTEAQSVSLVYVCFCSFCSFFWGGGGRFCADLAQLFDIRCSSTEVLLDHKGTFCAVLLKSDSSKTTFREWSLIIGRVGDCKMGSGGFMYFPPYKKGGGAEMF